MTLLLCRLLKLGEEKLRLERMSNVSVVDPCCAYEENSVWLLCDEVIAVQVVSCKDAGLLVYSRSVAALVYALKKLCSLFHFHFHLCKSMSRCRHSI